MQEHCKDFSENDYDTGCCLYCSNAEEGCLCYECKCKKCYWYSSPQETGIGKGVCDKVEVLKEEKKQKIIDEYREAERKEYEKTLRLQERNKKVEKIIKEEGEIVSVYTCQKCKRSFCTQEEFKIIVNKEPVCFFCEVEE